MAEFRLIDSGLDKVLDEALRASHASIRIVCPFIQKRTASRLLRYGKPKVLEVVTRFNLDEFVIGVSDTSALRLLFENGAKIRGVCNLHAKLYLLGESHAIVTSANLTESAFRTNHELGFAGTDSSIVESCHRYFERLWRRAGEDLEAARLTHWELKIAKYRSSHKYQRVASGLGDEGTDIGIPPADVLAPPSVLPVEQSFVKFFGRGDNRAARSMRVIEEVRRSDSNRACTYPKGKRPRSVRDGAIMYMGRLVKEPHDILIYGRAVATHHEPGRDDATTAEIRNKVWKERWPHYVRVSDAEFIGGTLANGVSLKELMNTLREDSFGSTQRNARKRRGNRDPRKAYMRQAAVELSPLGAAWLDERLNRAIALHARLVLD